MAQLSSKQAACSASLCTPVARRASLYSFAVRFFAYCFFYYFYAEAKRPQRTLAVG